MHIDVYNNECLVYFILFLYLYISIKYGPSSNHLLTYFDQKMSTFVPCLTCCEKTVPA